MNAERSMAPMEVRRYEIGERDALRMIGRKYNGWLDYHWTQHTSHVIENTGEILNIMHEVDPGAVTERDVRRGRLLAAFHDFEQDFVVADMSFGGLSLDKIVRNPMNEEMSASAASKYMKEFGFSGSDIGDVRGDIDCTIAVPDPDFTGTFYQPKLQTGASLTGIALGLADLGCAGMEGPARFHEDGAAWFRELFIGVREFLDSGELSHQDDLRQFMMGWLQGQVNFAKGRKERTEIEINLLPKPMQEPVRSLFPHFEATIHMTQRNLQLARQFSFSDLITFFGYRHLH